MIVLMAAFNAFSHGTQDLYPTFLQQQHHFSTHLTGTLTAIMNVGAIVGGISFGIWSEKVGRKRAIIVASLLAHFPYSVAYIGWAATSIVPYLAVMRAIVARPFGWLLAAGFPVVLTNALVGQNGFLTASLIGGTILTRISPDWTAGKYLFVSALPLADYYTGEPPPYDGMSMLFCIALLGAWAVGATVI